MRLSMFEQKTGEFSVARGVLDELGLDEVGGKRAGGHKGPSLKSKLRDSVR